MDFIEALESRNIEAIRSVPKSDLHNHQSRAANPADLERWFGVKIPAFRKCSSVEEMNSWYRENVRYLTPDRATFELKIKSAFLEAKRESEAVLCLSIGMGDAAYFDNGMEEFVRVIEHYRTSITPDTVFIPEISLCRLEDMEVVKYTINAAHKLLEMDYFKSVDLVGDENISAAPFAELYKECRRHGMRTRSHLGEFTDWRVMEERMGELELTDIQHGIAASWNPELMACLCEKDIVLHVCPTSNVMLGNTPDYSHRQLRTLLDNKVKVTINTDDLLIFNSTVSEEYLKLYQSGNFSARELDRIRRQGLEYARLVG